MVSVGTVISAGGVCSVIGPGCSVIGVVAGCGGCPVIGSGYGLVVGLIGVSAMHLPWYLFFVFDRSSFWFP